MSDYYLKKSWDSVVKAFKVISIPHHEVHEAHMFIASYKSPEGADIADNSGIDIVVWTGVRYAHFVFDIAGGGDLEIQFFEDAEPTDWDNPIQAQHMNRNGIMTPTTGVYLNPTIPVDGIRIVHALAPGGSGPFASGGNARAGTEWVLKPSTVYLLRSTNRSGGSIPMSVAVEWYEQE